MIRELEKSDYHKGFLNLINYFTRDPKPVSYEEFVKIFESLTNSIILVIEEEEKIVGTAKLILEQKFHNNFSKMGHVEDVVVLEDFREKGFGSLLIKELIKLGNERGCYKIVLNCNLENVEYYKKLGFIKKGTEMNLYV